MKNNKLGIIIYTISLLIWVILFQYFTAINANAEGTKEIMPYDTCSSSITIYPRLNQFATQGADPDHRLHIHIKNIGEKIYYGFGKVVGNQQIQKNDLKYLIKDPLGNIVVNISTIPNSSSGFINTYQEAVNGPNIINPLGYQAMSYIPTMVGDFYIEFFFQDNIFDQSREIKLFDITVTNGTNSPIKGRVWSKEWLFIVPISYGASAYESPFYGNLYMYSKDKTVTKVNFNGMRPRVFSVTANSTGTSNTGNNLIDRKSISGDNTYPEYKIFLNDPDSLSYPSGVLVVSYTAPMSFTGCLGNYKINIHTSSTTSIQLLIELNGINGYQAGTEDILIIQNTTTDSTAINWNGLNGLGQAIPQGTTVNLYCTMASGLTHMPLYDVEHNPDGFKINLVRPIRNSTQFNLYWDDSSFPNSIPAPSGGCLSTSGCHDFPFMFGDQRTINTWWYTGSDIKDSLQFNFDGMSWLTIGTSNPSCANTSDGVLIANIHGGKAPFIYQLNNSIITTNLNLNNLDTGFYSFSVTDANNCQITDSIRLNVPAPLQANFLSIPDTCGISAGILNVINPRGFAPFRYNWSTGINDTLISIEQIPTGFYTVTITDNHNCPFIFSDSVLDVGTVLFTQEQILHDTCGNGQGQIQVIPINGTPPFNYQWNTSPSQNINSITNLSAGNYSVTISDSLNCSAIENYQILDMPPPVPNFIIPTDVCINSAFNVLYNGNQVPPDNFDWNFHGAQILSGVSQGPYSLLFNNVGTYTVSLGVSKAGCPSDSSKHTVEVHKAIINLDSIDHVNCFNGIDGFIEISLSDVISPYTIQWNNTIDNNLINNQLSSGNYQIIVSDLISCTDTLNVFIQQPDKLIASTIAVDASCSYTMDGIINASATGGTRPYKYQLNNLAFALDSSFSQLGIGNYQIAVNDAQGCKDSTIVRVDFSQDILADFNAYSSTFVDNAGLVDFTFTGHGAQNFIWDFGDNNYASIPNPNHKYSDFGDQWIELIVNSGSPYNCWDTTAKMIEVKYPFKLFVPNAFTPNNDGLNDIFTPVAFRINSYKMNIYNRLGELLYTTYSLDKGWNGKYKNKEMTMGVYAYLIIIETEDGRAFKKAGTFTLLL